MNSSPLINKNHESTIGFIIVTHAGIGHEMLQVTEKILKEKSNILSVNYDFDQAPEEFKQKLSSAIQSLNNKKGIIILTDMFGATPTNLCRDFCAAGKIELVTGCNLPILLKATTAFFQDPLDSVARYLKSYGSENIRVFP